MDRPRWLILSRAIPCFQPQSVAMQPSSSEQLSRLARVGALLGTVVLYLVPLVTTGVLAAWVLELWKADFGVPFRQDGDAVYYAMLVKSLHESGWAFSNPFLGAPGQMELFDFPVLDTVHLAALKLGCWATGDPMAAMNWYFLATFPLSTWTSLFVLRHFHVSYAPAVVASIAYAFLPFHFLRGEGHYFLSCYWLTPLMVMVALWIELGWPMPARQGKAVPPAETPHKVWGCLICAVVASAGVYYAFFGAFLVAFAGLRALVAGRNMKMFRTAVLFLGVTVVALGVNLGPSLWYKWNRGPNLSVAARSPAEAEMYALKITQLFLPIVGHRVPVLADVKASYYISAPLVNENDHVCLGVFGATGLAILFANVLLGAPTAGNPRLLRGLALLNLAAILMGTIGGFGSLFALFGSAMIRGYNRIVVYIAFLAVMAAALCLHWLCQRLRRVWARAAVTLVLAGAILPLIVFDQTSPLIVPDYSTARVMFYHDAAFVRRIEGSVPETAMIFQLPCVPFPEAGLTVALPDYQMVRGYLHSKALHWSYAAIKGRQVHAWQQLTAGMPPPLMLKALSDAGFQGVYIDRRGYADRAAALEAALTQRLGPPLVSADGSLVFYCIGSGG